MFLCKNFKYINMVDYDFIMFRKEFERDFDICTGYIDSSLGSNVPRVLTCENINKLIPPGDYTMLLIKSKKFSENYPYLHILGGRVPLLYNSDVKMSRGIRIHVGNNARDTHGCILIGEKYSYTENMPVRCTGILNSVPAYIKWMRSLPSNKSVFRFRIVEDFFDNQFPF